MNFKKTLQKIESSKVFKEFKEKNPDAELCAGFFIIDLQDDDSKHALDYLAQDKIFTFTIENQEIIMREDKLINDNSRSKLEKISKKIKIEIEDLKGITGMQALEHGISSKFQKIIAVLQNYNLNDKKILIWNLTCILDGLVILNILINSDSAEIIKFEKKSVLDFVKK